MKESRSPLRAYLDNCRRRDVEEEINGFGSLFGPLVRELWEKEGRYLSGDIEKYRGIQVESWVKFFGDPDPEVRATAALALRPTPEERGYDILIRWNTPKALDLAISSLIELAEKDQNGQVKAAALQSLSRFEPRMATAFRVVPLLIRFIETGEDELKISAAEVLPSFLPVARDAIPVLIEALGNDAAAVRLAAATALTKIDPEGRTLVGEIGTEPERRGFLALLAELGEPADTLCKRLFKAWKAAPARPVCHNPEEADPVQTPLRNSSLNPSRRLPSTPSLPMTELSKASRSIAGAILVLEFVIQIK